MNPVQEKLAKQDTWTRSESLKYLALAICLLAMAGRDAGVEPLVRNS